LTKRRDRWRKVFAAKNSSMIAILAVIDYMSEMPDISDIVHRNSAGDLYVSGYDAALFDCIYVTPMTHSYYYPPSNADNYSKPLFNYDDPNCHSAWQAKKEATDYILRNLDRDRF